VKITEIPIIVFDTESTGPDPQTARVCEFGIAIFEPGKEVQRRSSRINPGVPIPQDATAIHGISDAMVAGAESFAVLINRIVPWFENRAPCGYNALHYDIPLIARELELAGITWRLRPEVTLDPMVFVSWVHRGDRERKLGAICDAYGVRATRGKAHSAAVDCQMTGELLLAMVARGTIVDDYEAALAVQAQHRVIIDREYDTWGPWIYADRVTGRLRIGAGKHCGRLLADVEKSYLTFIKGLPDMNPNVIKAFENAIKGRHAEELQESLLDVPRGAKTKESGEGDVHR
jgi:DNA polymerase-3 subunit epsilon